MNLNIIYVGGAANNAAPTGFYNAVNYVVNYYDNLFTNNVTINIDVDYGKILNPNTDAFESLSSGDLGENYYLGYGTVTYTALRNVLISQNAPGSSTLPSNSPEPGNYSLVMNTGEAKALGFLSGTASGLDGSAAFSSSVAWDFSPTTAPTENQYYLVGSIEHEFSEVMGRDLFLGPGHQYFAMDLYRYAASGVLQTGTGGPSYFSINGGVTNLDNWNNFQTGNNGDLGDWAPSAGPDSYLDNSNPGVINPVTNTDIILMEALGWTTAGPTAMSVAGFAANHATLIVAGQVVTINVTMSAPAIVTGTPTLQLNDNEVAVYASGSGSNILSFTYVVQLGDNISNLKVTGLNLPSGDSIQSLSLENLIGGASGNLGLTVNTATVSPTSVEQEILGLYSALYNRATDFNGVAYWVGVVGQQPDGAGVTVANAETMPVTLNDETVLGQAFVNTQATFFNQTYGSLNDSQFINALYVNLGGNAGDPGGIAFWANLLTQAEASGESVQAARAGLVGQFVHDLVDVNLAAFTGLTPAQLLAAEHRQETIDNKIAVSLALFNASQQAGGNILVVHIIGDAAYQAATTILQGVTNDPATVTAAITGINNAVAHQNILLI